MPILYGGQDTGAGAAGPARGPSALAVYGTNGATPAQKAATTLVATFTAATVAPTILTTSFATLTSATKTFVAGQKLIVTMNVAANVSAAVDGVMTLQVLVDAAVSGPISVPYVGDSTGVSGSFTFEVSPAPGTHTIAVQAKYTSVADPATLTVPTGLGTIVGQIVTV